MSHPITKLAGLALAGALIAHAALDLEAIQYDRHETHRLDLYYATSTPTPTPEAPRESRMMSVAE